MCRIIPLTKGESTKIDTEDLNRITRYKWYFDRGYARRRFECNGVQRCMHMHREILQAPDGFEVDHINGDTLDNRKANLRLVTRRENQFNSSSHMGSTSKFKGVFWYKHLQRWRVRLCIDRKSKHIGYFDDEVEAAKAYNVAALNIYGEYAKLNLI